MHRGKCLIGTNGISSTRPSASLLHSATGEISLHLPAIVCVSLLRETGASKWSVCLRQKRPREFPGQIFPRTERSAGPQHSRKQWQLRGGVKGRKPWGHLRLDCKSEASGARSTSCGMEMEDLHLLQICICCHCSSRNYDKGGKAMSSLFVQVLWDPLFLLVSICHKQQVTTCDIKQFLLAPTFLI